MSFVYKKPIGVLAVFLILCLATLSYSQSSKESNINIENALSVYDFIEKLAGSRNFDITTNLTFDVIDGEQRKKISFSFDMKIKNLEIFTFYLKAPEVLKDIVIKYDIVSRKTDYVYKKYKSSEAIIQNVSQVNDVLISITDFLSTPLFDVTTMSKYIEFKPKNAQVLARFGVQPITVRLYVEKATPRRIEILNNKTDEKIALEFEKFVVK
ncbi:hypothetical protein [Fervidobacterium sp.]